MDVLMEHSAEKDAKAAEALEAMLAPQTAEPSRSQETEPQAEATDQTAQEAAPEESTEVAADDDVTSLRSRLAEREAAATRYEEQLAAVRERGRQSLDAVRQQMLRKSSVLDRARQVIEKAMAPDGVDKTEAERLLAEIRSSYNASSANYEPPPPPQPTPQSDENSIAINEWLNDNGLTEAEAASFDSWIRTKAQLTDRERRLTDPYTLLTAIAPRWREAARSESVVAAQQDDATRAVKTVARVQRQAAKAASQSVGAQATRTVGKSAQQPQAGTLTDEQLEGLLHQMVGR